VIGGELGSIGAVILSIGIKGSNLLLTHESFPFDKMIPGKLDPEMIEDTAKIVNEAIKEKVQTNFMIAQKIADRLHSKRQQRLP